MKLADAVTIYLRDQPIVDALSKDLNEAKKTIKTHCRTKGLTTYRKIGYGQSVTTRLDLALARTALGPKRTKECSVESMRETLTLPEHLRPGAVDLEASTDPS